MTTTNETELNEEELRKLLKPNPSWNDDLKDLVQQSFGPVLATTTTTTTSEVSIELRKQLDSYDDCNYWIKINGINYLLKIHNGVESQDLFRIMEEEECEEGEGEGEINKSVLWLQNKIMETLVNAGIGTNRPISPIVAVGKDGGEDSSSSRLPIPGISAQLPVVSQDRSPCNLVIRLLGWVEGRPMSDFPLLPIEALADAGRFLGNLSKVLGNVPLPSSSSEGGGGAAQRYHQWDGKNTADVREFVQYIDDERKQSMVNSVIDAFQSDLIDSGVAETNFTKSLIHGDFNDANYLLDDNFCVTGVIDFGDSVESWRILDLSVAMAYAMLTVYGKQNRMISAAAAFLRGYTSVCPISDIERQHLVLLVACRLSCSVTLGAYSYKQNPENEYLLLHATPAWDALDLIWGTDVTRRAEIRTVIDGIFDQAYKGAPTSTNVNDNDNASTIDCSDLAFPDPSVSDPLASVRVEPINKRAKTT